VKGSDLVTIGPRNIYRKVRGSKFA